MQGATIWLTGLSGAGKTTIARALEAGLRRSGRKVEVLDGDIIRQGLSPDLGFSREAVITHVTRVGFMTRLLARNGVLVVVAVIAPDAASRDMVRAEHGDEGLPFLEVYVSTPIAECERRDVKGLYAAYRAGTVTEVSGLDAPYDEPFAPDLALDTTTISVDEAVAKVTALLVASGVVQL